MLFTLCTHGTSKAEWEVTDYQSRYVPGVAQRVPGSLSFPYYMTTAQDGGKVVSPTHRPPLPPRKYSRYSFLLEAESTPGPIARSEGFYVNEKFPMTPPGIESSSFRFVAQHRGSHPPPDWGIPLYIFALNLIVTCECRIFFVRSEIPQYYCLPLKKFQLGKALIITVIPSVYSEGVPDSPSLCFLYAVVTETR